MLWPVENDVNDERSSGRINVSDVIEVHYESVNDSNESTIHFRPEVAAGIHVHRADDETFLHYLLNGPAIWEMC